MTYQQAAFALFASLALAGQQGQAPTTSASPPKSGVTAQQPRQVRPATPPGVERVKTREAILLDKLKALLEPVGITVHKSTLIDGDKVKFVHRLLIKWGGLPTHLGGDGGGCSSERAPG